MTQTADGRLGDGNCRETDLTLAWTNFGSSPLTMKGATLEEEGVLVNDRDQRTAF